MIHTNPQHPELIVAFRWRAVYKYYYFIIRGDDMSYGWATVFTLASWIAGYFLDEFISWDDPMGLRIVLPIIVMGCCIMKFIKDNNQLK